VAWTGHGDLGGGERRRRRERGDTERLVEDGPRRGELREVETAAAMPRRMDSCDYTSNPCSPIPLLISIAAAPFVLRLPTPRCASSHPSFSSRLRPQPAMQDKRLFPWPPRPAAKRGVISTRRRRGTGQLIRNGTRVPRQSL